MMARVLKVCQVTKGKLRQMQAEVGYLCKTLFWVPVLSLQANAL